MTLLMYKYVSWIIEIWMRSMSIIEEKKAWYILLPNKPVMNYCHG
jgi:hypothetical protein